MPPQFPLVELCVSGKHMSKRPAAAALESTRQREPLFLAWLPNTVACEYAGGTPCLLTARRCRLVDEFAYHTGETP
ncbi:MAG: hypothetical protein FJ276_29990 [Planctomycetes bacterium]|nr:hypothetical protein [Planctomycetota bacterium]